MKIWKNTLINTKMALTHQIKKKDEAICSELHK